MTIAFLLKAALAIVSVFLTVIVIHEFGHFMTAKLCGVAVPQFAVGFGPKLIKWKRSGTEYSVRLFLVGGLVQLAGEIPQDGLFRKGENLAFLLDEQNRIVKLGDVSDVPGGIVGNLQDLDLSRRLQMTISVEDEVRTYQVKPHALLMTSSNHSIPLVEKHEQVLGKPLWQRALIILAGPVMNFLLAGVLFAATFMHQGVFVNEAKLGQVVSGSAAATVGLKAGDDVTAVNGVPVRTWIDLVTQIRKDKSNPPAPLRMNVVRAGNSQHITVTPRLMNGTPILGINNPVTYSPVAAVKSGFQSVYYTSIHALQLYVQLFQHHEWNALSGPVGIADVISHQAQTGFWNVVMIAGLLSLNLGLFNLLPFPALDGGRLFFMIVEAIRGKSVDPRKEGLVHFVGFALLMLFAVVITYRDVTRLF